MTTVLPVTRPGPPVSRLFRSPRRGQDVGKAGKTGATRKTAQRRAFAIRGYVGANANGKSLAMVLDTLPSLRSGRPVLSNVRLLDFDHPRPCDDPSCRAENHGTHMAAHPLWIPLTDYSQLLDARSCDVLLDEVTGIASSRESSSLPVQVVNLLVQLRRRDVMLSWTAPAWARADKVLREVTQAVVHCRGFAPVERPALDGSQRTWRDRRLFHLRAYDAVAFDDFTAGKRQKLRPAVSQFLWRPGSDAERAYDTLDSVTALGWAMESGLCMACGGKRTVPRCSCDAPAPAPRGLAGGPAAREGEDRRPTTRTRAEIREASLTVLPGVALLEGP